MSGLPAEWLRHFSSRPSASEPPFKINNPFKNKRLGQIDNESKAFGELVGDLENYGELFQKAGRISFNPPGWRKGIFPELSRHEKAVLEKERKKGFFQQTKTFKYTVVALWLSAIIQGWIQSTLNGANLNWWQQTGLEDPSEVTVAMWRVAGTNAAVFFIASTACWLSDPLQSRYLGRRGILLIAAVLCLAAGIGAACVHQWYLLLACRVFLGISMGLKGSVTPIFAAEISPSHLRGSIVMGWQAGVTLGIWLGFSANLIVSRTVWEISSWRWQTATVALPALCLIVLIWTIPDSPRLYLRRGQYKRAFDSMCLLREIPLQAARDLFYINAQLQVESDHLLSHIEPPLLDGERQRNLELERYQARVKKLRWWNRVSALVADPRTRRALHSALIVMIAQQLCGFNVLAFYSNNFFTWNDSQDGNQPAGWLSWGIGLCNFVCTIPAFKLIDRWGRVSLLLATYPGMMVFMLAASLTFLAAGDTIPKTAVEALVYLFTVCYSLGQGPVAFTYSAEVFPLVYRESGMSMAVAGNLFGAGLLTLFIPQAQFAGGTSWATKDKDNLNRFNLSQAKMLGTFVGLQILAYVLILSFVPETAHCTPDNPEDLNHMSLEELNCIFEQPTFHHTRYRYQAAIPNAAKRLRWWLLHRFTDRYSRPPHRIVVYRWKANTDDPEPSEKERPSTSATQVESVLAEPEPDYSCQDTRPAGRHVEYTRISDLTDETTEPHTAVERYSSGQYLDFSRQPSFRIREFERDYRRISPSRSV